MMKRKKTEATPESKDFWPIPGVDGEDRAPDLSWVRTMNGSQQLR